MGDCGRPNSMCECDIGEKAFSLFVDATIFNFLYFLPKIDEVREVRMWLSANGCDTARVDKYLIEADCVV